ncbi:MAG: TraU family protein [Proteobacteria bacterium]|nr:TraU family protein [Pseudomonadota bacterium]MBU1649873.1 TraU family protein [Pseudomonadota bacterium]
MKNKHLIVLFFLHLLCYFFASPALAALTKSGDSFNLFSDINWEEVEFTFLGICICPRPPPVFFEEGEIYEYWEPFLLIDTVSVANYSPFMGSGGESTTGTIADELGGKNKSSDAVSIADESTFFQAHGFLIPLMEGMCARDDFGAWWSEYDSMWQNDELAAIITPEVALYANKAMQLLCMTDAAAVNVGFPLDVMPWCIGSSGSTYPLSGHVDNDNIVQASNTVASRLIFKLCRLFMICDPSPICGCEYTPIWTKSHYKMHTARPALRATYPIGKAAKVYDSGLNPPYQGEKGSNDEFLWVVFRKQLCCTCCED